MASLVTQQWRRDSIKNTKASKRAKTSKHGLTPVHKRGVKTRRISPPSRLRSSAPGCWRRLGSRATASSSMKAGTRTPPPVKNARFTAVASKRWMKLPIIIHRVRVVRACVPVFTRSNTKVYTLLLLSVGWTRAGQKEHHAKGERERTETKPTTPNASKRGTIKKRSLVSRAQKSQQLTETFLPIVSTVGSKQRWPTNRSNNRRKTSTFFFFINDQRHFLVTSSHDTTPRDMFFFVTSFNRSVIVTNKKKQRSDSHPLSALKQRRDRPKKQNMGSKDTKDLTSGRAS